MKDMGIIRRGPYGGHNYHLAWGWRHGFMLRWPFWIKALIVRTWNPIACFIWGHDWFGPIPEEEMPQTCSACSKTVL